MAVSSSHNDDVMSVKLDLEAASAPAGERCVAEKCSRFRMHFQEDEPWMHHRLCGVHLQCTQEGTHYEVCRDWSSDIWHAFAQKLS